jgi:CrcB protein
VTAALFVIAAGLGAVTRLQVNRLGWTWLSTLAVNVIGSFLLGWLVATRPSEATSTVLGTGFLGSLTTFSMFAIEATEGGRRRRIAVLSTNLVLGLGAVAVGHALGSRG